MSFVQLMEYKATDPAEVRRIHDEWAQSTEGKRNARRLLLTKHHEDADRFCELVFFDSYEEAMENSDLPETQRFAERMKGVIDGDVSYVDLDVVDEQRL
jgi:hypothetical protein